MFCCTARRAPRVTSVRSWNDQPGESGHDGSRRRNSVDSDEGSAASRPSSLTRPFDPQLVNKACRELDSGHRLSVGSNGQLESLDGGLPGVVGELSAVPEDSKPWWHTQLQTQMNHARIEGLERMRRRRVALALAEEEQQRRVGVETSASMLDTEERKRRREFAKRTLAEEQHTRVREQQSAEARDLAERDRRRRWAVKALTEEERGRIEERLSSRERGVSAGRDARGVPEAARMRHEVLLMGVRLWVLRQRAGGAREGEGVARRLKDIYTRECLKMPSLPQAPPAPAALGGGAGAGARAGAREGGDAGDMLLQARKDRLDSILSRAMPAPFGEARSLAEVVEERRRMLETYSTRSPRKVAEGAGGRFSLPVGRGVREGDGVGVDPKFRPMPAFALPPDVLAAGQGTRDRVGA